MTCVTTSVGILVVLYLQNVAHIFATDERCEARRISVNPKAEARFTYLIKLREGGDTCENLIASSVQYVSILEWAVNKLNAANFVPGVEIGFDVLGDCGVPRYGVRNVLDVLSYTTPPSLSECSGNQTSIHLGIVGPSTSLLAEAVLNVVDGMDVPVIGTSATLPELSQYPNFLRVSLPDTEQVKVIVDIMKQLGLTYVAAIYTDDNYGIGGMRAIKELAEQNGICIDFERKLSYYPSELTIYSEVLDDLIEQQGRSKDQSLCVVYFGQSVVIETLLYVAEIKKSSDKEILKLFWIMSDFVGTEEQVFKEASHVSKRVFTVSPSGATFKDLETSVSEKWDNVTNGLVLTEVDDLIFSLIKESGNPLLDWTNGYIQSTLDAIYVLATGLKEKHSQLCSGQSGMCSALREVTYGSLLTTYKDVDISYENLTDAIVPQEFVEQMRHVSFDSDGELVFDITRPEYDVFLYDGDAGDGEKFSMVGQYQNNMLRLNTSKLPQTQLISQCEVLCLACRTTPDFPYVLLPGDLYLIGIFSHHEENNDEPFKCGDFRHPAPDIITMEAFLHAMGRLKNITGLNFGALVFDDCYSPARTGLMMSSAMSGYGDIFNNLDIDTSKIVGVVGAPSSGVTVPIAMFFSRLAINTVSPSASSPDLDDRINYPHFLRTVPSDLEQAKAMVEIITSMGWEYVSLLYVDNNYGQKGAEAFIKIAVENKICVADPPISMSENTDDPTEAYRKLGELRNQGAHVVVYFGIIPRMSDLLAAMKDRLESEGVREDFIFIASEDWGDDPRVLDEAKSVTRGSITLKNKIEKSADIGFEDYLSKISIDTNHINPWFPEFWMEYFKCSIKGGFDQRYDNLCSSERFSQQDIRDFLTNQRVIHVLNAVYALGMGLQKAIDNLCMYEVGYPVCDKIFEEAELVTEYIRTIELTQNNQPFRVFKDDGNGDIGFKILNVHQQGSSFLYKEVGTYDASKLILNENKLKFYDKSGSETIIEAKCGVGICGQCAGWNSEQVMPPSSSNQSCQLPITESFRLPDIIVISILGGLVLLMLLALIIVCACFSLKIRASEKRLKDVISKVSATPVYQNEGDRNTRRDIPLPPVNVEIRNPQTNSNSFENVQEWRQLQRILNMQPVTSGERINSDPVHLTNQDFLEGFSDMPPNQTPHPVTPQNRVPLNTQAYIIQQHPQQPVDYPRQYSVQSPYNQNANSPRNVFYFPESRPQQNQNQDGRPPLPSERRPTTYPPAAGYNQNEDFDDPNYRQEVMAVPNGYLTVHSPMLDNQQQEATFATLPRTRDRHMRANQKQRMELANSTERISRV